jgi:hypothetical protein
MRTIICEICDTTLAGDGSAHYSRHLANAKRLIEEVKKMGLEPNRAATAREWLKICAKNLKKKR